MSLTVSSLVVIPASTTALCMARSVSSSGAAMKTTNGINSDVFSTFSACGAHLSNKVFLLVKGEKKLFEALNQLNQLIHEPIHCSEALNRPQACDTFWSKM